MKSRFSKTSTVAESIENKLGSFTDCVVQLTPSTVPEAGDPNTSLGTRTLIGTGRNCNLESGSRFRTDVPLSPTLIIQWLSVSQEIVY